MTTHDQQVGLTDAKKRDRIVAASPRRRLQVLLSIALLLAAAAAIANYSAPRGLAQFAAGTGQYGGGAGYGDMRGTAASFGNRQELQGRLQPFLSRLREAKTDDDKKAIKGELSGILASYFEQDMQRRSNQVDSIEQRVERLRGQLEQRKKAKEEILELQLRVLENEAAGLGFFGQGARNSGMGMAGGMGMGGMDDMGMSMGMGGGFGGEMDDGGYDGDEGGYPGMRGYPTTGGSGYPGMGGMMGLGGGTGAPIEPVPQPFTKRTAIEFADASFEDVFEFLGTYCGANIYVDRAALKEVGVQPNAAITISLKDISVAEALALIAHSLSGSLGVRFDDDIAIIGSSTSPSKIEQLRWANDDTESSRQTEKRLGRTGDYAFKESPLSEVVNGFEQSAEVDVFLSERTLSEAGVSSDAPVSINLKNVKHRTALRLILDSVDKSLYFTVLDGVVLIAATEPARDSFGMEDAYGGFPGEMAGGGEEGGADETKPHQPEAPASERSAEEPAADLLGIVDASPAPTSGAEEVKILETQVESAEAKFKLLESAYHAATVGGLEFQEAKSALEVLNQQLAKAKREWAAQERLLQLDVQKYQLELGAVQAQLEEAMKLNSKSHAVLPRAEMDQKKLAVALAEIALERAQTLLDLHVAADASSESEQDELQPEEEADPFR